MLTRRQLLLAAGVLATSATAAGCGGDGPAEPRSEGKLLWWDHFQPREKFERKLFERFAKEPDGLPVDYTVFNPEKQGQALQLAKTSNQLPDVFTLAGVNAPPAQLVREGWFAPLELDDEARKALPTDALFDGLSVFDGKPYSFPVNSPKEYAVLVWYNRELFERAGLDPDNPPSSYDDWRAAGRAIRTKAGTNVYGWILPLGFAGRMREQTEALAQAAGSTDVHGVDLRTGEYVYHSEPYVQAIEFLLSLKRDGTLFPASAQLDARSGRARWATGVAGMFTDGCYCIGVVKTSFAAFADKMAVAPAPVPEAGAPIRIYQPPQPGTFWISGQSKHVAAASKLVSWFIGDEHQRDIATSMASPPFVRSAIDEADVHPTYRKAIEYFDQQCFLAPDPVVRNPAVAKVLAAMRDVKPGLPEIVQGAFSGDVPDYRKALRTLSDKMQAERSRAIAEVAKKGQKVSEEDFAFPDWEPGRDFGPGSY
ncbi:MAG TPA: extracellular solute-binding protein [Actinopolymorphaceae bacterium]|jgi:multiple sugar transport system substrate-binding protein